MAHALERARKRFVVIHHPRPKLIGGFQLYSRWGLTQHHARSAERSSARGSAGAALRTSRGSGREELLESGLSWWGKGFQKGGLAEPQTVRQGVLNGWRAQVGVASHQWCWWWASAGAARSRGSQSPRKKAVNLARMACFGTRSIPAGRESSMRGRKSQSCQARTEFSEATTRCRLRSRRFWCASQGTGFR